MTVITSEPARKFSSVAKHMEICPAGQYDRITRFPVLHIETDINSTEWICNISYWKVPIVISYLIVEYGLFISKLIRIQ